MFNNLPSFGKIVKIVADDQIPFVPELFSSLGTCIQKPGVAIHWSDVQDADILLTRTITPVNAELLDNTSVRWVGSATAGYDHLDTSWLEAAGIAWAYAPGANATTVAHYVEGCVSYLMSQKLLSPHARAGVIGVGRVGTKVVEKLQHHKFHVVSNDPPRAAQEKDFVSTPLTEFDSLDLICVHTPLTTTGPFSTYHLLDTAFLKRLKPGCVLLNAGRGAVIDHHALLFTNQIILCLDVWENEPQIHLDLLKKAVIATPHIAGYSRAAKFRATLMLYEQATQYFQLPNIAATWIAQEKVNQQEPDYHPEKDTQQMKKVLLNHPQEVANYFRYLRRDYVLR